MNGGDGQSAAAAALVGRLLREYRWHLEHPREWSMDGAKKDAYYYLLNRVTLMTANGLRSEGCGYQLARFESLSLGEEFSFVPTDERYNSAETWIKTVPRFNTPTGEEPAGGSETCSYCSEPLMLNAKRFGVYSLTHACARDVVIVKARK